MKTQDDSRPERRSPRDFRPWEQLDFLPSGCFLYLQAAREIADAEGWSDAQLEELQADMAAAINSKALPTVSRKTGLRKENLPPEFLGVVTPADVNVWLEARGASYRWSPAGVLRDSISPRPAAPEPGKPVAEPARVIHSIKGRRRNILTPVIELAQQRCRNPDDAAEVWAMLQVLAEKKEAPLLGATEDGLQYLKGGSAAIFTRKALGKRLTSAAGKPR